MQLIAQQYNQMTPKMENLDMLNFLKIGRVCTDFLQLF